MSCMYHVQSRNLDSSQPQGPAMVWTEFVVLTGQVSGRQTGTAVIVMQLDRTGNDRYYGCLDARSSPIRWQTLNSHMEAVTHVSRAILFSSHVKWR